MRIQLLSDLHLEFHRDDGLSLVHDCYVDDVEVLVLAGDIAMGKGIGPALQLFSERYARVLYVHGNHEFYHSDRATVVDITRQTCERLDNVYWLDGDEIQLEGQRFVGAPLWFPDCELARRNKHMLSDYALISDYEQWVYVEHERARKFFETRVQADDVVISHYLPSTASVSPPFIDSPLNCYFVADVEYIIHAARPGLWLHGHTHGSVDTMVGDTRVVCNPFGYAGVEENPEFRPGLVIDVPACR